MTRAVVFLAILLTAASLGFAQGNSRHPASVPAAATVGQNSGTSGAYQNANSKPSSPAGSSAQQADWAGDNGGAATSSRNQGIQTNAREEATANGQLPQTSTLLPLLGLIGLGSLIAGLFARR